MKLIKNNKNLTYQGVLELLKKWIDSVRSGDAVTKENKRFGLPERYDIFYSCPANPFGQFEIFLPEHSIFENNYFIAVIGAVVTLRTVETDSVKQIRLSICPGYLFPEYVAQNRRAFVSNEICSVTYLFYEDSCAVSKKVNGLQIENISDVNLHLISPAVKTFLHFLDNVIEGGQEYKWLKHNRPYNNVWMKKPKTAPVEE